MKPFFGQYHIHVITSSSSQVSHRLACMYFDLWLIVGPFQIIWLVVEPFHSIWLISAPFKSNVSRNVRNDKRPRISCKYPRLSYRCHSWRTGRVNSSHDLLPASRQDLSTCLKLRRSCVCGRKLHICCTMSGGNLSRGTSTGVGVESIVGDALSRRVELSSVSDATHYPYDFRRQLKNAGGVCAAVACRIGISFWPDPTDPATKPWAYSSN